MKYGDLDKAWKHSLQGSMTIHLSPEYIYQDTEELFSAWICTRFESVGGRLYYGSSFLNINWKLEEGESELLLIDDELLADLEATFKDRVAKLRKKLADEDIQKGEEEDASYRLTYKGPATQKQLDYIDGLLKHSKGIVLEKTKTSRSRFLTRGNRKLEKWEASKSIMLLNRLQLYLMANPHDIYKNKRDLEWIDKYFKFPFSAEDFPKRKRMAVRSIEKTIG